MLSDEKGYAFTPLTLLLFIPIVILAISYGNIVSEANMLANIATGGDVTYTVAKDVINNMKLASESSGRNAAYWATRNIIDNHTYSEPIQFFGKDESKIFIKRKIAEGINDNLINTTNKLSNGTGRDVYIHNKHTDAKDCISINDLEIYQTDPFGFYVTIKPGIPIKVVQEGQTYMGVTPNITSYVSIEGLEDAYIWVNTKERYSSVFNAYPYYSNKSDFFGNVREQYFFNNEFNTSDLKLHYLWECLNGTNNPSGITPRPYYFPDKNGLSFFDRLENRTLTTRDGNENVRLSTFVLEDPQAEVNNDPLHPGKKLKSAVDSEYFNKQGGFKVIFSNKTNHVVINDEVMDPSGTQLVLSTDALDRFGLKSGVDYTTNGQTAGNPGAEVYIYV